jgi:hypothetical protein
VTPLAPGQPRDADGPVFAEPWEAQAFALAVALHERGVFTWPALEKLVAEKGLSDAATLQRYADAWEHAADRTPHGTPIELRAEDFGARHP